MSQKKALSELASKFTSYSLRQVGAANTIEYQLFLEKSGQPLSFFHDVPLEQKPIESGSSKSNTRIFNMVVEIPRWTNAKAEVATKVPFNPIKLDSKNGKARFVKNLFPYTGYIWNYGALPQTWEDPNHSDPDTHLKGDNDPVDVIEIGQQIGFPGQIKQVKILGTLALLDEGETDWKMIAIDLADPKASSVNDISDVEAHFPGLLAASLDWFRNYKRPDGKPQNKFAFDGKPQDADYALRVIDQTHSHWKALVESRQKGDISTLNSTLKTTPFYTPNFKLTSENILPPANLPEELQIWHFFTKSKM
ncbi:Inorganic pyrophosphatase [Entomophthora muscae]|uniref:Inorganic pyrophosphatase n=1 Tax=Entomophthora muscae TaxID=34485 RepID=A0ACC2SQ26_9FUNG|nr:Inorganic pyrophosphatase [Entomophthora muscae]